ncbi:MAG: uroporphyrinogen-III synthase [Candidatus Andeanibacterium colombiense]|uniref:Uroporphyrinogen-III synthase n=1 Tax=Candidatus Andeanibacterium colombiense TaxID=3121345 RepID=A0AAJ6BQR4_9SPHN|nr:MAG: uroporphyrinogen-III synthase [Sphingomonadaceae bacterium]
MTRVVAIRPEPGLSATLAQGCEAGLDMAGWPLFEVRPCPWEPPAPATIDGVLLGSANAIRHAGATLAAFAGKPAYAVGASTAEAARRAGFTVAAEGQGGLQQVLATLNPPLRLLRLAGAKRVPLAPPPGIVLETRTVYESVPLPVPSELAEALRGDVLVLLHSGEAAAHLAGEVDRLGLDRGRISLAALGPRIAAAAGTGWREVRAAENPREAPLLALAGDMCH